MKERNSRPTKVQQRHESRLSCYPEAAIDGYSRNDSGIEFYLRVGALVSEASTVLDYGAGRGVWFLEPTSETRKNLQMFKGRVRSVIGVDLDPIVTENPTVDESQVMGQNGKVPLSDESVDVVVSDFTFEHIADPSVCAAELARVVKPGGWICARTPNRRGYIGFGARMVPNSWHVSWLKRLQPGRKAEDVFPVAYHLNTPHDIDRWFPPDRFESIVYTFSGEPRYAGASRTAWVVAAALMRLQPRPLQPMLLVFLRKRV